jgi:hypothetical protein
MPYFASIGTHVPSGGVPCLNGDLNAKRHPPRATGVAQFVELFGEHRGEAAG